MAYQAPSPTPQPTGKETQAPKPTPPEGFSDWASL
ncbi:hypothetical protein C8N43_0873 [Litoreibacter ponti]|uniref:Uncharacterized protein n=1 Tax=Litoreibacter ponti TaxID=1510457 RepID=A0A2T6BJI4_9RHOB|nr:hypothetical protein C8N43_0873 [Litoreibacter ponti]